MGDGAAHVCARAASLNSEGVPGSSPGVGFSDLQEFFRPDSAKSVTEGPPAEHRILGQRGLSYELADPLGQLLMLLPVRHRVARW
jgi:hypothetical protein